MITPQAPAGAADMERGEVAGRRGIRIPPASLRELKFMIARKEVVFPGELGRVMRAVLDRPETIAFGTVTSVAAACGVSPTTVVRLARHLGFASFRDLKRVFQDHLRRFVAERTGRGNLG